MEWIIGKMYTRRNGDKCICIADARGLLPGYVGDYPIIMASNTVTTTHTPGGRFYGGPDESPYDIMDGDA
jgi:hypothetical protein